MSDESEALSLLGGIEFKDNRLYSLLDTMIRDFYALDRQVNPPVSNVGASGVQIISVGVVMGFFATLYSNNLRLEWQELVGTSFYEIRYKFGDNPASSWDTASVLVRTPTLSADINPISIPLIYGNHTFFIKASDTNSTESDEAAVVVVNIPQITAPTITPIVIDNNVLLKWTIPDSVFRIDYYNVYKDGTLQGIMNGTFEVIFETTSGSYTYKVEAVDIVGNIGTSSSVVVHVDQPPDFELTDSRISALTGTKVNVLKENDYLLCCLNLTETFATHFTGHSWTKVDDQIAAGFPLHDQPTLTTGSYEEIIDYGTIISNTIITLTWSQVQLAGSSSVVCKIATSVDNITYTSFATVTSLFSPSLRYAKIRFEFTGVDTHALIQFSNIQIRLDVKREMDSGSVNALASDASGTAVLFNKDFLDVDSITLSVAAIQPITAIYSFVDIPNPSTFYVFAYDSSGNRVDYLVSWKARGIV